LCIDNFKYIKNASEKEGTILIYKQIGNSMDAKGNTIEGINGNEFANEMEFLQNMCDKITVRINSPGGNVMEGYAIASSILHSKKPVHTIIDGVALSVLLLIMVLLWLTIQQVVIKI
jgi:ATP-dependent protease ClpP protease subunit